MRKHHQVRGGQIVRVIDGPLTGFRGEVKEVDEQTARVAVQVFGRVTPMDFALGQIELVPENSTEAPIRCLVASGRNSFSAPFAFAGHR
jgi:hypothetical protein